MATLVQFEDGKYGIFKGRWFWKKWLSKSGEFISGSDVVILDNCKFCDGEDAIDFYHRSKMRYRVISSALDDVWEI